MFHGRHGHGFGQVGHGSRREDIDGRIGGDATAREEEPVEPAPRNEDESQAGGRQTASFAYTEVFGEVGREHRVGRAETVSGVQPGGRGLEIPPRQQLIVIRQPAFGREVHDIGIDLGFHDVTMAGDGAFSSRQAT